MSKVLSVEQIQKKIDDIESRYYKGWTQSEEWWRINGDVTTTDRRLWVYYHNLLNKRKVDLMLEKHKESVLKKAHNQLQDMYEPISKIISDKKEKEIILTLIQDLSDKLIDCLDLDAKEKYEHLAEQLVGDDATDRYTHQELINEVNRLKDIEERENENT